MYQPLNVLPIESTMRKCLHSYGFSIVKDILTSTPEKLSKVIKRELDECRQMFAIVRRHTDSGDRPPLVSGADWIKQRIGRQKFIPTLCQALDAMIAMNGFPLGRVIEFYGEGGSGKTQLW